MESVKAAVVAVIEKVKAFVARVKALFVKSA